MKWIFRLVLLAQLALSSADELPLTTGTLLARPWGAASGAPGGAGEASGDAVKPTGPAAVRAGASPEPAAAQAQGATPATTGAAQDQRSAALVQAQNVRLQLEEARRQLGVEASRQSKLRELLAQTRNYSAQCRGWIAALGTPGRIAGGGGTPAARRGGPAGQLQPDRAEPSRALVADSGALVAKVGEAEGTEARLVERLRQDTKKLESLGPHFAAAEEDLRKKLATARGEGERANRALESNVRQIGKARARKDALLKEAEELRQQLSPVATATIQAENDAYRVELAQALRRLRQQEAREARAAADASQVEAGADVQRQAAARAASDVQTAAAEGRRQLAAAVAQVHAREAKSEGTLQEAKEVVDAKCRDRHAAHSDRMRREVNRCAALEQQLTVTKARVEATGQALRAQQAALYVSN